MSSLVTLSKVLFQRSLQERKSKVSRADLKAFQARQVAEIRAFAVEKSPFYRRFHHGMEGRPLQGLPVLTKPMLMENFDELITDRGVRLADARAYLGGGDFQKLFQGRYVVLSTSGSSGVPGVFLYDQSEWIKMTASLSRALLWAGIAPSPLHPKRIGLVTTTAPSHYSSVMGHTLKSKIAAVTRIDVGEPIEQMVKKLNASRPHVLGGYPSVLRLLAVEQVAGRLQIRPEGIASAAEVLTNEDRRRLEQAFKCKVFDTYGATEYVPISTECASGGRHLMEDGAVIEVEDKRLLLTVFGNRTLPLIRYQIDDVVQLRDEECPCGRPHQLISSVEGRAEETLVFDGMDAPDMPRPIEVHPAQFHRVLDASTATGWQVVNDAEKNELTIRMQGLPEAEGEVVVSAIRAMLIGAGVDPAKKVVVVPVDRFVPGATGKVKPIVNVTRTDTH